MRGEGRVRVRVRVRTRVRVRVRASASTARLDVALCALLQHDVLKAQVPVTHPRLVRVPDCGADLPHDLLRLRVRAAHVRHELRERHALDLEARVRCGCGAGAVEARVVWCMAQCTVQCTVQCMVHDIVRLGAPPRARVADGASRSSHRAGRCAGGLAWRTSRQRDPAAASPAGCRPSARPP